MQTRVIKGSSNMPKRIEGVSKDGNVVQFESISDATRFLGGTKAIYVNILRSLKGKRESAYGFKWSYV